MKLSQRPSFSMAPSLSMALSLAMAIAGGVAALGVLKKRRHWEKENNRVAICMDFDDLTAAATRAGLPLDALATRVREAGATHVSIPEYTLQRLLAAGKLSPRGPVAPVETPPPVGHWNYLFGDPALLAYLADELSIRLPYSQARVLSDGTLAFAGDLVTMGGIGLGFEREVSTRLSNLGLGLVPRPVSYDWPEKTLLERTLAQAAALGQWVAFDGKMILGHEMHLDETLAAMEKQGLNLVYFAESRHQKGDWFVAKRRAPHIVLAHQFTPDEMIPLDFHAAAHNWAYFARERGIRFCYVNFFRVLHATAPLEGLHYLSHLKESLESAGFLVSPAPAPPAPIPTPQARELSQVGLATAGIVAAALTQSLNLPEKAAVPLTAVVAGGALTLPYLEMARVHRPNPRHHHADHPPQAHDHPHDHHHPHAHDHDSDHPHDHPHPPHHDHDTPDLEQLYPPSYAPKLLGLGTAILAPVLTATLTQPSNAKSTWLTHLIFQASAAAALAALTSGKEYQLRIEEYRGLNLDWMLPLAAASTNLPTPLLRFCALTGLAGLWGLAYSKKLDPLAQLDPGYAEGHTHHISAAQRLTGDAMMAAGPRPARKWAGLGPLAGAASILASQRQAPGGAAVFSILATAGSVLGLVGFRRPERALAATLKEALPSFGAGTAAGLLLLWVGRPRSKPGP